MKHSNDTIGNRTRDVPACSAVAKPTVPQRAPVVLIVVVVEAVVVVYRNNNNFFFRIKSPDEGGSKILRNI